MPNETGQRMIYKILHRLRNTKPDSRYNWDVQLSLYQQLTMFWRQSYIFVQQFQFFMILKICIQC